IYGARNLVFRYTVFAPTIPEDNAYGDSDNGATGQRPYLTPGTFLGGNAIRILVGKLRADHLDTPLNEAITFMHELGHSLGLGHGGEDDINFKPNYHSIMNNGWALANPLGTKTDPRIRDSFRLDYSHGGLNALNETQLQEIPGLNGN